MKKYYSNVDNIDNCKFVKSCREGYVKMNEIKKKKSKEKLISNFKIDCRIYSVEEAIVNLLEEIL